MIRNNVEIRPFEDCIKKVKYTKKVASQDFKESGRFPIVSQEEAFISGYWDNPDDVFSIDGPVVIFGDHSRHVKYVDFDFVIGADGVKILAPVDDINAKYFYYYLKSQRIQSLGYSRHYKVLKEKMVPVPSLADQQRIVDELDLLSGIVEKKNAQLKTLDDLAQSIFHEMFGDPIANERGWDYKRLDEVAEIVGGATPKTQIEEYWVGDNYWVTPAELHKEHYKGATERTISDEAVRKTNVTLLPVGTVLLSSRAPIGKVAITTVPMYCNQGFKNLICSEKLNNEYAFQVLYSKTEYLNSLGTGATFKEISKKTTEAIKIAVPPIELQKQFAEMAKKIQAEKEMIKTSLESAEQLFASRLDNYFNV